MIGEPALTPVAGFGVEPVDQIDDVEEASAGTAANAGASDADRKVSLAGARGSSVILPGVRRPRFGSFIRFTRAAARRW
jgi:hypothetical protein